MHSDAKNILCHYLLNLFNHQLITAMLEAGEVIKKYTCITLNTACITEVPQEDHEISPELGIQLRPTTQAPTCM